MIVIGRPLVQELASAPLIFDAYLLICFSGRGVKGPVVSTHPPTPTDESYSRVRPDDVQAEGR